MANRPDRDKPEPPIEGEVYTFEAFPLGMQSPTDSFALPYQEGHTPPEAADNPLVFYGSQPNVYSASPQDYYQWWHDFCERRKKSGDGPSVGGP